MSAIGNDEREALRRVDEGCAMIAAALRLAYVDPSVILARVESAVGQGADAHAEDIKVAWAEACARRRVEAGQ